MIVLHVAAAEGAWVLWGETADSKKSGATGSSARVTGRSGPVAKLPFAVKGARLRELFCELELEYPAPEKTTLVTLLMPTTPAGPLASSPLISPHNAVEWAAEGGPVPLEPWRVDSFVLPWTAALELAAAASGDELLSPGVLAGEDLRFWWEAFRFAGSLASRQQFLPGVACEGRGYAARWEPVLSGQDETTFLALARRMPGSCRAAWLKAPASPEPGAPPAFAVPDAGFTLYKVLGQMVDSLARASAPAPEPPAPVVTKAASQSKAAVTVTKTPFVSVHGRWLAALQVPSAVLKLSAEEFAGLERSIRDWRRPVDRLGAAPWRLCFRLEEPAIAVEDEDAETLAHETAAAPETAAPPERAPWHLRFLLQSKSDPSLLISPAQVWKNGAKAKSVSSEADPLGCTREMLLSAFGQAAALSPKVDLSLDQAAPEGLDLDAVGAHDFLMNEAVLLEQAGFGIHLPAWWSRRGSRGRLTARAVVNSPVMSGGGGLSMEEIIQFDWELALNGQNVSLDELRELARLKEPLIHFRGQWVQLGAGEIVAAQEFLKKHKSKSSVRDLVRMALGGGIDGGGIQVEGVAARGWIGDMLEQLQARTPFAEVAPPAAFRGELRPYQLRGYSWLEFLRKYGLGACLADDMGLGKTPTTLAFLQNRRAGGEKRPVLLVCPTSVIANWQKEAARFTPDLTVLVHHGAGRAKDAAFKKQAAVHGLVLSSYALLARDAKLLAEVEWSTLVLDEAQNVKNSATLQAKAARTIPADFRVALTGTPVENNVGDLWSLMDFLNPGFLGGPAEFRRRFFVPIQTGADPEAATKLQSLTAPFVLRRLKTDKSIIADLPEKQEMKVFCTLTKEQGSLYEAVVRDAARALESAEGIARRGLVLATLVKLKQVCNHPAQFLGDNSALPGRSGKLARLTEMLEEVLAGGERALIFSQFREMGDLLQEHLQESFGKEVLFLHGGVSKTARDRMVERFSHEDGGPPIFVLSLKAGGVGLNLTRANHVFHFDRWWNPAVENQATDRAFRIGQEKRVQVHKFLCAGTLEDKIDEMIERKRAVAEQVVGAGESWLTELSTEELKDLFALRSEAFGD